MATGDTKAPPRGGQLGTTSPQMPNNFRALPRALRTWCRLFIATQLLDEPGRTVESVALQLDFESPTGLRNALKRYTGRGARSIRAAGGLAYVLERFTAACHPRRTAPIAPTSPPPSTPPTERPARPRRRPPTRSAAQLLILLATYVADLAGSLDALIDTIATPLIG